MLLSQSVAELPVSTMTTQTAQHAKMLIGGEWIAGEETYPVLSPIDGQVMGWVPIATPSEIEQAIVAAKTSLKTWGKQPGPERGQVLLWTQALLQENLTKLAQIFSLETGKPYEAARREITLAGRYLSWFAAEAQRVRPEILESPNPSHCVWVLPRPLGIVAILMPAQFSALMLIRQIAPALAAGCSVIVQPAPNTALTVLAIAQVFEDAGLLAGSLNVVTHPTLGANLEIYTRHPAVHKLVVSGSKQLEQQALSQSTQASTLKRVSVERFGPAPMLVFDDADLDLAVNAALHNKLLYSGGQSCLRSNRIFVHESIVEPFIAALQTQVESLSIVGMGTTDDGNLDLLGEIGPLLDIAAGQQLESLVSEACQQGARVITGGQRLVSAHHPRVYAYAPTILAGVQDTMAIAHHETTGPVILISSFSSDLELHDRIQCTSAATYLFTENLGRVFEFGDCLNTVLLGVNDASFLGHEVLADHVLEQSQQCTSSNGGLDTYLVPQNMLMRSGNRGGTAA